MAAAELDPQQAAILALKINLESAERINDNQRRTIEQLQTEVRQLKARRGHVSGWGDRS